jgi:hypothetical protein
VEAYCVQRSIERGGVHPTIKFKDRDFWLWFEYFDRHLGGLPWVMRALCANEVGVMAVPEQNPEWFDDTFQHYPGYEPILPRNDDEVAIPAETAKRVSEGFAKLLAQLRERNVVSTPKPKTFQRYSDADLERLYAHNTETP